MTYEDVKLLPKEYYKPSESFEHYDSKTNTYYNLAGQALRNPSEYQPDADGIYEPFGDE